LANTKQASKRARQAKKHRELNVSQRSTLRTCIKKVVKAILEKNKAAAQAAFNAAQPIIDRFAGKGLIHKNAAARYKSRLSARIKAVAL
jgi:small subunit ribosomal protein S20